MGQLESMESPEGENRVIRYLSWIAVAAIGSFFVFYVITPWAYDSGPALLFVLACFSLGFQWRHLRENVDRQSLWFLGSLGCYFLSQLLVLMAHGEDISEFDLSFRYAAAALVLLFLLVNAVRAAPLFFFVGLGGALAGVYAVYLFLLQDVSRIQSFDNPIHFGNGAMALSCLCAAGLVWALAERRGIWWPGLMGVGIIGGVTASILSGTRSGWVAVPMLVVLIFVIYRDRLVSPWRWLMWSGVVAVVVSASLVQVGVVEQRMLTAGDEVARYFESGVNDTSVGLRLDMYKAGLAAFGENPLIGVGPAELKDKVDELVQSGEIHPQVAGFRHLHNQYIDNMARYGIVGLSAYLVLLLVPFGLFLAKTRSSVPSVKALGVAGVLFVGFHGVVNLTQSMLERNIGVMMFVFVLVFLWAAVKQEERVAGRTANSASLRN